MRKQIKKLVTLTLALAMCFGTACYAHAETIGADDIVVKPPVVAPAFVAIAECGRSLSASESFGATKLNCYGYTDVYSGYTSKVVVELQQYTNGSWTPIKTWTDNPGSKYSTVDANYYVTSGIYRVKTSHYAYNSSGVQVDYFSDYTQTEYV